MEKSHPEISPEIFVSEFDRLKARAREMAYHIIERVIEEPRMRSMDPTQMEPVLQSLVDDYPYLQYIYVIDIHGKKITRTICQPIDQAKLRMSLQEKIILDRLGSSTL